MVPWQAGSDVDLPSCRSVLRAVLPEPTAFGVAKLVKFAWEGTHSPPSCTPACCCSPHHAFIHPNMLLSIPTCWYLPQHFAVHPNMLFLHGTYWLASSCRGQSMRSLPECPPRSSELCQSANLEQSKHSNKDLMAACGMSNSCRSPSPVGQARLHSLQVFGPVASGVWI